MRTPCRFSLARLGGACYIDGMATEKAKISHSIGAVLFLVFLAFGVFCGIQRCNTPNPPREPVSATELHAGQRARMAASIPSGHVVWQDIGWLRQADEQPEQAQDLQMEAERTGKAHRIPGGAEVTVRKVAARPNAEGFYYVQIQYRNRCWWVEETALDL